MPPDVEAQREEGYERLKGVLQAVPDSPWIPQESFVWEGANGLLEVFFTTDARCRVQLSYGMDSAIMWSPGCEGVASLRTEGGALFVSKRSSTVSPAEALEAISLLKSAEAFVCGQGWTRARVHFAIEGDDYALDAWSALALGAVNWLRYGLSVQSIEEWPTQMESVLMKISEAHAGLPLSAPMFPFAEDRLAERGILGEELIAAMRIIERLALECAANPGGMQCVCQALLEGGWPEQKYFQEAYAYVWEAIALGPGPFLESNIFWDGIELWKRKRDLVPVLRECIVKEKRPGPYYDERKNRCVRAEVEDPARRFYKTRRVLATLESRGGKEALDAIVECVRIAEHGGFDCIEGELDSNLEKS